MDVDEFRAKLHVLAVDDERVSLMLIDKQLRHCRYNVTTVMHAETALEMLRARRDADRFDLVITDVHMPGMDGFKLVELIGLEMDIPVIMLSANDTLETMMKGIKHGALNYLVKPVCLEQLKNLWIHVVAKNMDGPSNSINNYSDDGHHQLQSGDSEDENVANHTSMNSRKKKKEDGTREDKEAKRQRIQWSGQLHRLFVEVVHQLGIDKAFPKKIVEMMNVEGLTRDHVASHLQKYRLFLKKVSIGTYRSRNPFADETVWSEGNSINTHGLGTFGHNLEHGRYHPSISFAGSSNSSDRFARMNSPAAIGKHGMLPTQSVQLITQRNLSIPMKDMGSVGYGTSSNSSANIRNGSPPLAASME